MLPLEAWGEPIAPSPGISVCPWLEAYLVVSLPPSHRLLRCVHLCHLTDCIFPQMLAQWEPSSALI